MKIKLLTIALMSAAALAACADNTDADMTPPPDGSAMTEPAMDPMSPEPMPAASGNPMVGGAAMDPDMDIVANASNSAEHTTLVAAVQAAGLVETLQSPGPFTVFAPTDSAFMVLPEGALDQLLEPDSKDELAGLLTYHVVEGAFDSAALKEQIVAGNGQATLTTVSGGTLTVGVGPAGGLQVIDSNGGPANLSVTDVRQSNGVIHVVDEVLMP